MKALHPLVRHNLTTTLSTN